MIRGLLHGIKVTLLANGLPVKIPDCNFSSIDEEWKNTKSLEISASRLQDKSDNQVSCNNMGSLSYSQSGSQS